MFQANFSVWLKAIHSRKAVGLTSDMEQWLTHDNVFSFLKIFDCERNYQCKKACCQYIVDKELLSDLSEKDSIYFDCLHLPIRSIHVNEILANQKLKIRECRIDDSEKYKDLDKEVLENLKRWLRIHGKDISKLEFEGLCKKMGEGCFNHMCG